MTENKKFNTGNLVRLKSGGPLMTVNSMPQTDGLVSAEWFVEGKLQRDRFDVESLVRVEEPMELTREHFEARGATFAEIVTRGESW